MSKPDIRKLHLRFLLVIPVIVVCFFVSRAHVESVEGTYRYPLSDFAGSTITAADVQIDPPSVASVLDISYDGNTPVLTLGAGEPGEGAVTVSGESFGMQFSVRTDPSGLLLVDQINFSGWEVVWQSVVAVAGTILFVCLWTILDLKRCAWFGYEMAAYSGAALFLVVQIVSFISVYYSGWGSSFAGFALAVTDMANVFVTQSMLPMAILAVFVCISNVALIHYEGKRLVNLLGIAASVAWFVATVAWRTFSDLIVTNLFVSLKWLFLFDSVVSMGFAYGTALFSGTCITAWLSTRHTPSKPRNYLVILGCGIREDGTCTPLLQGRVDAALAFARAQEETGYAAPVFVPSGGKGPDEVCAEAEAMRRYLVEQGVDEGRIVLEDRSTSTRENMRFSAEVIRALEPEGSEPDVAFATTNYHVFRGYVFGHEAGLAAEGISAKTKLYFWPNAFLREFVGLLAAKAVPIVTSYLVIAVLYFLAEYVVVLG